MTEMGSHQWPAEMRADTLAAYLDIGSKETLYRKIREWPGFPKKNPITKRWGRDLVDDWRRKIHGITDNVTDERRELREKLGLG